MNELEENKAIKETLTSLLVLPRKVNNDPISLPPSPSDIEALKNILVEECERLKVYADHSLSRAKFILKFFGLHYFFHEINTFVESDNRLLIESLFHQVSIFIEKNYQVEPETLPDATSIITSLKKKLRVKSQAFHQLPCTPKTALKRVEILKTYLKPESRILFIGDDDLVSVALALAVPNEIIVIEIDLQVIDIIEQISKERQLNITCRRADIRKSLPQDIYFSFDIAITDPIYTVKGLLVFLSAAEASLKKSPGSFLVSCCSRLMAGSAWQTIEEWVTSRGLVIQEFFPGFNEYYKTARLKTMLQVVELLCLHSPISKACVSIPFVYSDLMILRFLGKEEQYTKL